MHRFTTEGDFDVLVMDLLGHNLERLVQDYGGHFSLPTVLAAADQCLRAVEQLHSGFYVHRDVKPENLAVGVGKKEDKIHIFDFGLAKRYINDTTREHIGYKDGKEFVGTVRYASVNAHLGIEQSRRDDLESLGFVLVYLAKGSLPWQGLVSESDGGSAKEVLKKMLSTSIESLCHGLPGTSLFKEASGVQEILSVY
eukprot:TRINITY_DN10671_c0_g1_i3.p2 TRINITY_DN10671_c0_g1~~TRINITY_DN10671_c0_g1_i3.p2  ORF type:complete len:197 (-),score=52.51 TRINITY_DN10671_c0_g1_i3:85-675(-)